MLLLRLENGWRIVGKAFHRREPPERPRLDAPARAREEGAVRALLGRWSTAMDTHDGELLAGCALPRAVTITPLAGEAVTVSLAEWQARYAERRRKGQTAAAQHTIRDVVVLEDIAVARFDHRPAAGGHIVDHALLVKLDGAWKVAVLTYVRAP